MSTKIKAILITIAIILLAGSLGFFAYSVYSWGKVTGEKSCAEQKVQVVEKVVTIVKQVNKQEQQILLRPNDNWNAIYKRICAGEKDC